MNYLLGAIGFLFLCAAAIILWRSQKRRSLALQNYLQLLENTCQVISKKIQPTGYPRLTLQHQANDFDIQIVPDGLTFRKLPCLWVMVTLPEALPVKALLDVMNRPTGQETFSNFNRLPHSLPLPDFLPEGLVVRSNDAKKIPPQHILQPLAAIFQNSKVKEFILSPKGIRLVFLAEEADRGRFLIFRDSEMGQSPLPAQPVLNFMQFILQIRKTILDSQRVLHE